MENTLTAELTGAMLDVPDAATGLVHLGGGRWYDPALGRPLQPNPAGAPPTVPQALNRYAATPLGQPGVFQSAVNSGGLGAKVGNSTASNTVSALLAGSVIGPTAVNLAQHFQPWYLMNISVVGPGQEIRGLLKRLLNQGPTDFSIARRLENGRLSSFEGFVFTRANVDDLVERLGQRGVSASARSIGRGAERVWNFGYGEHLTVGNFIAGAGADFGIGGLWQGVSDAINYPGLWTDDPWLASRRVSAAGLSNATTGVMGTASAGIILTLAGISDPPALLVFGIGVGATVFWDVIVGDNVTDWWFTIFDANDVPISRELEPLN